MGVNPGMVLISETTSSSPREQQVDAREALAADGPVGIPGELEDRPPCAPA